MSWEAKWIWLDAELPRENVYGIFRRRFALEKGPAEARTVIACDSRYQLFVNGRYVGRGVAPNFPDEPFHDTWDLAPWLCAGENVIAVLVYHRGFDTFNYVAGSPGLFFQMMEDDAPVLISDRNWKALPADAWSFGPLPRISGQQGMIEVYDARREPLGWRESGFDDSGWRAAKEVAGPGTILPRPAPNTVESEQIPAKVAQRGFFGFDPAAIGNPAQAMMADAMRPATTEALREAQSLCQAEPAPVTFHALKKDQGSFVILDMGRESTGTIRFEIEAAAGIVIDIGHGEHLDDGRVRAFIGGRHFADRYITREGRQSHEISFRRVGCRYVQLNIRHGEAAVVLRRVSLLEEVYPFEERGAFACSDTLLNEIWKVSAHTLRCCVHENYEDCPWREQSQYAGDTRLQILAGYRVFGETVMPRKALGQFAHPAPNGLHLLCSPGISGLDIPGYDLVWVPMIWEYYQQTGDLSLVREQFPEVKRLLAEFARHARPDGILGDLRESIPGVWQFTDWSELSVEGIVATQNLFYLEAIQSAARLAGAIGEESESARLSAMAAKLGPALVELFRLPGAFRLADNRGESGLNEIVSQHTHSMALLLDLVPKEERRGVAEALLSDPRMAKATLYFKYYLFAALLKVDRAYLPTVLEIIRSHWGMMLRRDATTFWEREDAGDAFDYAGSLCHAWSAHPTWFFATGILGVQATAPGGAALRIAPNPGDLSWAKGSVPFPEKDVAVAWEKGPGSFSLEATIPAGAKARVILPILAEHCCELAIGGGPAWRAGESVAAPFVVEEGMLGVEVGPGEVRLLARTSS